MLWRWGKEAGEEGRGDEVNRERGRKVCWEDATNGKVTKARRLVDEHQEATRDGGSGRYATCVNERCHRPGISRLVSSQMDWGLNIFFLLIIFTPPFQSNRRPGTTQREQQ